MGTEAPLSVAARSRYTGASLSWVDGEWFGQASAVTIAKYVTEKGSPLMYVPGFRDVTPADGALVYAVATIRSVLGPVDWLVAPPEGHDDVLFGDQPDFAVF